MNSETKTVLEPHGPARAYYNRTAGPAAAGGSPTLTCLCGWVPTAIFDSWEAAGLALDKHIADSLKKQSELITGIFEELRDRRGELLRQRAGGGKR
jgi:hypothetical protein